MTIYKKIIRPLLFRFRADSVHNFALWCLQAFGKTRAGIWLLSKLYRYDSPALEREVFGIRFSNPIGLAAGYDTDAAAYRPMEAMGFGFVEAGTITPRPQPGNVRPHVFRLPKDNALINRSGHPNGGMEKALFNLRCRKGKARGIVVGANIAANTLVQPELIPGEYLKMFRNMYQYVDYFVVNVSGGGNHSEVLQSRPMIESILEALFEFRRGLSDYRPILLKVSPDWNDRQIDDAVDILVDTPLDGLVVAGTTRSREGLSSGKKVQRLAGSGGISGAPLLDRALELIGYIGNKMEWRYPIIGSGGVMTPADARRMLDAGASLIQIYTGLVYNGPAFIRRICKGLNSNG